MKLRQQKLCKMPKGRVRRKVASALVLAMSATTVFPAFAGPPPEGSDRYSWYIPSEDGGLWHDEEDEDRERIATDSDAEYATWSNAVLTAMESFNSKVEFVDSEGKVLEGNTPDELSVPQDEKNFPYLSQQAGRTREDYGFSDTYEEHEYFLKGSANIYDIKDDKLATASNAAKATSSNAQEEYVDRIIVFKPKDAADFSGVVFVDILNASSKTDIASLWRQSYDYIMEKGAAYVGVTSKDVTVKSLKTFNQDRYAALKWGDDNGIFWDILGQVGTLLKQENSPILYGEDYSGDVNSYLFGSSQSGWYVNTFANNFGLANFVAEDAADLETYEDYEDCVGSADHIFDGYLNFVGGMMDTSIAKKQSSKTRMFMPVKATDVPFILMVGENDYNPGPVRHDSDDPDNMYRHYVVAGGPHSDIIFPADPTDELQMQTGRDTREYVDFKGDHTVTDFNITVFINAALENLDNWAQNGEPAPEGQYKDEVEGAMNGMAFAPERDEFGNMTSGIISPQISVPVASYYGGANGAFSDKSGSMIYLAQDQVESLYGDRDTYLDQYAEALDTMIEHGWILESDREKMIALAENEPFFGETGRDSEAIEASMEREIKLETVNQKEGKAGDVKYTETEYLANGEANVYTRMTENTVVRTRHSLTPYKNYVRVAVPENFNGKVVLDPILEKDGEQNVQALMKEGKAYVGIAASLEAAEKRGGEWRKAINAKDKKDEFGLVWDIISQAAASIGSENGLLGQQGTEIELGLDSDDKNLVFTYQKYFGAYENYQVTAYADAEGGKELAMHGEKVDPSSYGVWSSTYQEKANGTGEPVIGATAKNILEVDGKYFKDSNGNGKLDVYEDWREDAETRAADLVSQMTVDDKIGMMFNNSRGMGINSSVKDKTGLLDETEKINDTSIFGTTSTLGTIDTIEKLGLRHFILRQNPEPEDMADWINQMNYVAEGTSLGIPVLVTSNSRNENGDMTFGMNDASGVFSTWPGTMGLAAAAKGDIAAGGDASLISRFAEIARSEWDASGLKKGYMYMVDTMTDPRWQRTYGTFGEDPEFIADAAERLVVGFQGSSEGVQTDGIALTIKHFPGGGARENGFDPHYKQGQWNVYQTEDSLQRYHLPGFKAAVDNNVSSIMPYYAKPAPEKSEPQYDNNGNELNMQQVGFAFNKEFIQGLLRDQMGHDGYVNSDSGIIGNMDWGVEELDVPEKCGYAVNAGTDIIGDTNDVWSMKEAYERSENGSKSDYYDTHEIAYGFTREEVTVSNEDLDRANERLLKEMFELGLFENPYRDPDNAKEVVDNPENWDEAYEAHQKSVVLLKNKDQVLPLTEDKLEGKTVYVEYFSQKENPAQTEALRKNLAEKYGIQVTEDYNQADYAILFVNPKSGNYFSATAGYLELDICDGKIVHDVDELGRPAASTHAETTLQNAGKIKEIADAVHNNGGKVISNVNFTLAWMLGNVEPYADALLAGFDTYADATMDVIVGDYNPTGKMPITLPKNDEVIAVNADGVCISPNDVPGYLKDQYMPEEMKDRNGKAYAYRDSENNYYELNYGLSYEESEKPHRPSRPNSSNASSGGSAAPATGNSGAVTGTWSVREDGQWIFKTSGGVTPASCWQYINWNGTNNWYYFNADGSMAVGWISLDGQWYYLHAESDGTRGHMYTGWHQINGKWYYFHNVSDGTRGRMLTDTTTPDGYKVGPDGVWIP